MNKQEVVMGRGEISCDIKISDKITYVIYFNIYMFFQVVTNSGKWK